MCAFSFSPLGLPSILWHTLHFFSRWRSPFFCKCNARDASIFSLVFTLSTFTSILFQGEELSRRCRFPKGPSSKMNRRSTLFHLADNKTKGRKIFWSSKLLQVEWFLLTVMTHTKNWTLIYHPDNKRGESPVAFTSFLLPSNLCHFLSVCYH